MAKLTLVLVVIKTLVQIPVKNGSFKLELGCKDQGTGSKVKLEIFKDSCNYIGTLLGFKVGDVIRVKVSISPYFMKNEKGEQKTFYNYHIQEKPEQIDVQVVEEYDIPTEERNYQEPVSSNFAPPSL